MEQSLPGVRESLAGHDFHMLWAMSLCLRMLQPESRLQRIVIEDVAPLDREGASARAFLTADVTEYYGGDDFETAERVVVSQLKYGQRSRDQNWIASLLAPKNLPISQTVLGKLTDAYSAYQQRYGSTKVADKLRMRFVSNRPCSPRLLDLLRHCRSFTRDTEGLPSFVQISGDLNADALRTLTLLSSRSGLDDDCFASFTQLLDFEQTGGGDRFDHEARIARTLQSHVLSDRKNAFRALYDLVRRQALPEAEGSGGISREDVLGAFEIYDELDLCPCPSRIERPANVLATSNSKNVALAIVEDGIQHIVAHGEAGIGKTTSLGELKEYLPPNSVVLLYDCFAAGQYRDPAEARHTPRQALRQLVNELAVRCGTPLLLDAGRDESTLWRRFKQQLEQAGAAVSEAGGRLAIVIDAADNAVLAAQESQHSDCFVGDLWHLALPPRVSVVMSCRSSRLDLLKTPDHVCKITMSGLDPAASATHLRQHHPDATDAQCIAFHENSNGNPRVQTYALEKSERESPNSVEACIAAALRTPSELFDELVAAARSSSAANGEGASWLSVLMTLERPVRLEAMAMVLDEETRSTEVFCEALAPGVSIINGRAHFRDEDFEAHVHDDLPEAQRDAARQSIAHTYWSARHEHGWAAEAVAGHLFDAGRFGDLIDLALSDDQLAAMPDWVSRSRVQQRRIELALRSDTAIGADDGAKLVILSMLAKERGAALHGFIGLRPDLAYRFGDRAELEDIWRAAGLHAASGSLHMRLAAAAAVEGDITAASELMDRADKWIRRRQLLPEEDQRDWKLEPSAVGAFAAAMFLTYSSDEARDAIDRCHPEEFAHNVLRSALDVLSDSVPIEDLLAWLDSFSLPAAFAAQFTAGLRDRGLGPPDEVVRRISSQLIDEPTPSAEILDADWGSDFLEMAIPLLTEGDVQSLAAQLRPALPSGGRSTDVDRWEHVIRFACLESLVEIEDGGVAGVDGQTLAERRPDGREGTRADQLFEQVPAGYGYSLGEARRSYELRARAVTGSDSDDAILSDAKTVLERLVTQHHARSYENSVSVRRSAVAAVLSVCERDVPTEPLLESLLGIRIEGEAPLHTWLVVAEHVARFASQTDLTLCILDEVVQQCVSTELPADDKASLLLRCVSVASRIDIAVAAEYYTIAVDAAAGLNWDQAQLIGLALTLSNSMPDLDSHEKTALAGKIRSAVESLRPHIDESSYLPWMNAVEVICKLDPALGIRTATSWDRENHLDLGHGIRAAARSLNKHRHLDVREAMHLLWLTDEDSQCSYDGTTILTDAITSGQHQSEIESALQWLANRILKDETSGSRLDDCAALLAWVRGQGFADHALIEQLTAVIDAAPTDVDDSRSSRRWLADSPNGEKTPDLDEFSVNAVNDDASLLVETLDECAEGNVPEPRIRELLERVEQILSPSKRIEVLDSLASVASDSETWRRYGYAIGRAMLAWSLNRAHLPTVRQWVRERWPELLVERLPDFVRSYEDDAQPIALWLSADWVDTPTRPLLSAASRHMHSLDTHASIKIAELLASAVPAPERLPLVHWILDQLPRGDSQVPGLGADEADSVPAPRAPSAILAEFTWALFGHPDARVRWRGAHVAIDQARLSPDYLKTLVGLYQDHSGRGHYGDGRQFFWMSAQVWTILVMQQLAAVLPGAVEAYRSWLADIAEDRVWPHALLRELARSALGRSVENDDEAAQQFDGTIRFANQPRSCYADRRWTSFPTHSEDAELTFPFSRIDTIPYWYESLGRRFALGPFEIARQAEGWITEHFDNVDKLPRWYETDSGRRYDYSDVSNDHGSVPRIETAGLSCEWHSMFLVAGSLADRGAPVVVSDYDDATDPWQDWLSLYTSLDMRTWPSETRSPVPIDEPMPSGVEDLDSWRTLSSDDFGSEILKDSNLVIYGFAHRSVRLGYEMSWVRSALVASEEAFLALVEASVRDGIVHSVMPALGDESDYGRPQPPLGVIPWLRIVPSAVGSLEEFDPVGRITPQRVISYWELGDEPPLAVGRMIPSLLASVPGPALSTLNWSDKPRSQRGRTPSQYRGGHSTRADIRDLCAYLSEVDMNLALQVIISRNVHSSEWRHIRQGSEPDYDAGSSRLYLLKQDTTLLDQYGTVLDDTI